MCVRRGAGRRAAGLWLRVALVVFVAGLAGCSREQPEGTPVIKLVGTAEVGYPEELRAAGVGGTVGLAAAVGYDGRVVQVTVRESSGDTRLDSLAVAGAKNFLFSYQPVGGAVEPGWVSFSIRFSPESGVFKPLRETPY